MFLPKFDVIRQLLESGALGEIRTVIADHGEYFTADHRIMRHDLAGGPLLDLGTYPISFAAWILGEPATVLAAGQPHPAGVNGQVSAVLADAAGNQAVLQHHDLQQHPDHRRDRRDGGHADHSRPVLPARRHDADVGDRRGADLFRAGDRARRAALRGGRGRALHHGRAARSRRCGRWPTRSPPCGSSTRSAGSSGSCSTRSKADRRVDAVAPVAAPRGDRRKARAFAAAIAGTFTCHRGRMGESCSQSPIAVRLATRGAATTVLRCVEAATRPRRQLSGAVAAADLRDRFPIDRSSSGRRSRAPCRRTLHARSGRWRCDRSATSAPPRSDHVEHLPLPGGRPVGDQCSSAGACRQHQPVVRPGANGDARRGPLG